MSRSFATLLILATVAACDSTHPPPPPEPPAQVLFFGGPVRSCVEGQPPQEALLVQDERVLAVGTFKEVEDKAVRTAQRVDLKGRTLMCAFVDGHIHAEPLGRPEWFVNSPEYVSNPAHPQYPYGPNAAEVVQLFRERARQVPAGTPIVALVSVNFWSTIGLDPRATFDGVSTEHPIIAVSWGGHGMAVNSASLALAGYVDGQPDPYGGRLTRDASGRLTGFVQELAEVPLFQALAERLTDAELVAHATAYVQAAWKVGQVRGLNIPFMVSEQRGDRIYAQVPGDFWRRACLLTSPDEVCAPSVGELHYKIFVDGSPDRCEALVKVPYVRPETCPETVTSWLGFPNLSNDHIDRAIQRVANGEGRLLAHALGDGAVALLLSRLEALGGFRSWPNITLEHGDLIAREDVERAKALGLTLVQNPTHLASVPPLSAARYEPAVVAGSEPLRSLLDLGLTVAFASDDFGSPTSSWLQLQLAVTHPFRPSEAITLDEALAAYTRVAAKARGWDGLGTLEPGKRASFQVLSRDPSSTPVAELATITSVLTVVDGQVAWSDGSVVPATP